MRAFPTFSTALLLLALFPPSGWAEEVATADVSAVLSRLALLGDGAGHYVAVVPFAESEVRSNLFYGDGKEFWRVIYGGFSADGKRSFSYSFWEPRVLRRGRASVAFRDGRYEVRCDDRKTELKPTPPEEAQRLLASAVFRESRWQWRPYALARDDEGSYYFVDRAREPKHSRRFRLWIGPRGDLKPQKLKNIVSDSEGDIFATRSGQLRLVLNKKDAAWVSKGKRMPLVYVPVGKNLRMIYAELGVYDGERLGTPCDDL